ncbi:MAG: cytochrome c [Rhodobacteraceae bacterium]|nr:cytochrome c [Paracoccaceae bacterium]
MKIKIAFAAIFLIGAAVLVSLFLAGTRQTPETVLRGQALYAENCASCHGATLEGQPDWRIPNPDGTLPAPPHNNDGHTWHHDDRLLFDYTKLGGAQAMAARGLSNFNSGMPAFEGILSDDEINNIWAYIRSTWGEEERAAQAERTALDIEVNG